MNPRIWLVPLLFIVAAAYAVVAWIIIEAGTG
jgi:hypothetical protein